MVQLIKELDQKENIKFDLNLLNNISKKFKGNKNLLVNLECGHIYSDEKISNEQILSLMYGKEIISYLNSIGIQDINNHLFIDNYHPKFDGNKEILDTNNYINFCTNLGFEPQIITFENSMTKPAQQNLEKLISSNLAIENYDKTGLVLKSGGAMLYDLKKDKFSCGLLDATYLQTVKLGTEEGVLNLTILPKGTDNSYKSQQKNMKKIANALNCKTDMILPVYFQLNGGNC